MAVLPKKNIAIILGQNMDNEITRRLGRGVSAIMLGEEPAKVLPELPIIKKLGLILGQYADLAGISTINLELEGPVLMLTYKVASFPEQKYPLSPIDLDKFVFKIAGIIPVPLEIKFFENKEKNEVFCKFDRSILFKK